MNLIDYIKDLKANSRLLSEAEIKSLMRGIFEAVQYIHKCGFLHRDIKPENMMLVGEVWKLVDFGTVKNLLREQERFE